LALLSNIVVHCSDSTWGSAAEIRRWHMGKGWRDIGYHRVIKNGWPTHGMFIDAEDGAVECGRDLDGDQYIIGAEVGAHALGYNTNSIGICMIGKDRFTPSQIGSLLKLLQELRERFHITPDHILGHYETAKAHGKTCPNIDMDSIRYLLELTDTVIPK